MKELIDPHQAHLLMLGVIIAAPLIGLVWGALTKRVMLGLAGGFIVGAGNYGLWTIYNIITDRLGLDTVKNLLVNLAFFAIVGIVGGLIAGYFAVKERSKTNAQGGDNGDVAGSRH